MKNQILILASILLLLSSCKKDVTPSSKTSNFFKSALELSSPSADFVIDVSSNYTRGIPNNSLADNFYNSSARSMTSNTVNGNLSIDNMQYSIIDGYDGVNFFDSRNISNFTQNLIPKEGSNVNLVLENNSVVGSFTKSIYIAKGINYQKTITSSSIDLNWNADANYSGKMYITIYSDPNQINGVDNPSGTQEIIGKRYEIDDSDGAFSIPASDLIDMPANSRLHIIYTRGTIENFSNNGKSVNILSYCYAVDRFWNTF